MNFLEGILYMMWRGLAIGVIISAPMGPVGILCVQRTLEKGRRTGFFTGVGAAISDLFYCLVTGFGLSLIEEFLKANQNIIQVIGSVVIAIFGIYLFKSNPSRKLKKPDASQTAGKRDVIQGFLFTFSNPLIIFLIIGLFARFNFLLPEISFLQCVVGYIFIIVGALGWWWVVSYFVDKVRSHFNLRSMWLINKITGSIIMVFALVGVITAVSAIASAKEYEPRYMNSARGFGALAGEGENKEGILTLSNKEKEPRTVMLPVNGARKLRFAFRARHGSEPWGITVRNAEGEYRLIPELQSGRTDPNYPSQLTVRVIRGDEETDSRTLLGGFDDEGWNSYDFRCADGIMTLALGNRQLQPAAETRIMGSGIDSVGIFLAPGSKVDLDWMVLDAPVADRKNFSISYDFGNPDVRHSYYMKSTDWREGVWEMFDRTLEESKMRAGGHYKVAIARAGNDYRIIYLDGAKKNSDSWQPGDVKANLKATGHKNIYDIEWLDPAHQKIEGEGKAQFASPDMLTLQFVDHESTVRLRKVELE